LPGCLCCCTALSGCRSLHSYHCPLGLPPFPATHTPALYTTTPTPSHLHAHHTLQLVLCLLRYHTPLPVLPLVTHYLSRATAPPRAALRCRLRCSLFTAPAHAAFLFTAFRFCLYAAWDLWVRFSCCSWVHAHCMGCHMHHHYRCMRHLPSLPHHAVLHIVACLTCHTRYARAACTPHAWPAGYRIARGSFSLLLHAAPACTRAHVRAAPSRALLPALTALHGYAPAFALLRHAHTRAVPPHLFSPAVACTIPATAFAAPRLPTAVTACAHLCTLLRGFTCHWFCLPASSYLPGFTPACCMPRAALLYPFCAPPACCLLPVLPRTAFTHHRLSVATCRWFTLPASAFAAACYFTGYCLPAIFTCLYTGSFCPSCLTPSQHTFSHCHTPACTCLPFTPYHLHTCLHTILCLSPLQFCLPHTLHHLPHACSILLPFLSHPAATPTCLPAGCLFTTFPYLPAHMPAPACLSHHPFTHTHLHHFCLRAMPCYTMDHLSSLPHSCHRAFATTAPASHCLYLTNLPFFCTCTFRAYRTWVLRSAGRFPAAHTRAFAARARAAHRSAACSFTCLARHSPPSFLPPPVSAPTAAPRGFTRTLAFRACHYARLFACLYHRACCCAFYRACRAAFAACAHTRALLLTATAPSLLFYRHLLPVRATAHTTITTCRRARHAAPAGAALPLHPYFLSCAMH